MIAKPLEQELLSSERVILPGGRLLAHTQNYVIYERRFYSDDPLACQEFAPSPDWWEFVVSLRQPDQAMLTCPRWQQPPPDQPWLHHHLVIQVEPDYLRELLAPEADRVVPELRGFVEEGIPVPAKLNLLVHTPLIGTIVEQLLYPPPVGSLRLFYDAKLQELIAYLCFQDSDTAFAWEEERVRDALEYLQEHLSDSHALQGVSERLGVSTRQCQRLFRVAMGCSPSEYLTELRLRRAAFLLTTTSLSVSEVALEVGYLSLSHFSKAFRLRFGKTPRQFRRCPKDRFAV